ncbi:MAG: UDP-3-O-(3-hydroxymyristoyl)glucosamine N-acyltransferase [Flavobacteriales bacterium]|nr:UDP-3-O-(3-hydroxymyristoyl)glucosamine N-acyltransferase [Flavobacteriales bacterium]
MDFTAQQIASFVNGKIIGDESTSVNYISKIEEGKQGTLSFLANPKYQSFLSTTEASIVLISKEFVPPTPVNPTLIVVNDAHESFTSLLKVYEKAKSTKSGIEQPAFISESSKIGDNHYIGAFVYISDNVEIGENAQINPNSFIGKNVSIGNDVIIGPGVKIYDDCKIGNQCVINAGSVIGCDGFGFIPKENGYDKIPQLGNVVLEDNVEIGANCTIDRASMGSTIIKKGTKLDNLIQIAHNVELGEHNVIASQTGIAGSTKIGNWNMIGGQAGFAGHLIIGNKNKFQAQSGIANNIKDEGSYYGSPALEASNFRRSYIYFKNLSDMASKIHKLEKQIQELKSTNV